PSTADLRRHLGRPATAWNERTVGCKSSTRSRANGCCSGPHRVAQEDGFRIEPKGDRLLIRGSKHLEPMLKFRAEHKAELLAVLGNSVHESEPLPLVPRFGRKARVAEGEPGLEIPCATRRGRTQEVEGAFQALLRRVRSLWGLRLWHQSTCGAARPLVLRRPLARSASMNPRGPNLSLSDDAPRMRRHREQRLLRLSCITTANCRQR